MTYIYITYIYIHIHIPVSSKYNGCELACSVKARGVSSWFNFVCHGVSRFVDSHLHYATYTHSRNDALESPVSGQGGQRTTPILRMKFSTRWYFCNGSGVEEVGANQDYTILSCQKSIAGVRNDQILKVSALKSKSLVPFRVGSNSRLSRGGSNFFKKVTHTGGLL